MSRLPANPHCSLSSAMCAFVVFAAGCGSSDDTPAADRVAVKSSRSAPMSPIPPFEEFGKTKTEFKGFDVELVEAIGQEDRPHA